MFPNRVVRHTPRLLGHFEETIGIDQVASVSVASGLIFGDVIIETTGGSQPLDELEEPAIELVLDFLPRVPVALLPPAHQDLTGSLDCGTDWTSLGRRFVHSSGFSPGSSADTCDSQVGRGPSGGTAVAVPPGIEEGA